MNTPKNPWDTLAETTFNTNVALEEVESNAADNIFISWPVFIDCIIHNRAPAPGVRALDFGCGAGLFSRKLTELGFSVAGVDSSKSMIKKAQESHGKVVTFTVGDADIVPSLGTFQVITSLMTLQFIHDAGKTIAALAKVLEPGGVLIFSTFTREYVKNAADAHLEFFGFNFEDSPTSGYLELVKDEKVPTYIRDADFYLAIAKHHGLTPILQSYPPFTEEFLRDYPHPVPTKDPEYMILGFKK